MQNFSSGSIKNSTIKSKLMIIVGLVCLGFSVFIGLNYKVATENTVRLTNVELLYFPLLEKTDAVIVATANIKELITSAAIMAEEEFLMDAKTLKTDINETFDSMLVLNPSINDAVADLKLDLDAYFSEAFKLTSLIIEDEVTPAQMRTGSKKMLLDYENFRKSLLKFRQDRNSDFNQTLAQSKSAANQLVYIGVVLGGIIVSIISTTLILISNNISKNLRNIIASLKDFCRGDADLTIRLTAKTQDETGQIVTEFNNFLDKLQSLVRNVSLSAEQVGANAGQLSVVAKSTSESTSIQTEDAKLLIESMSEVLKRMNNISSNVAETTDAASDANNQADQGKLILTETTSTIDKLKSQIDSSSTIISSLRDRCNNIGSVLNVIQSIAEKTNLLALNAAIEAARAGESGRGFAVVADEVRLLAGQTQTSTVEIQKIIEALQNESDAAVSAMEISSQQTGESVECIERVNNTLNIIAQSIDQIYAKSGVISTSIGEQDGLVAGMNEKIDKINQSAQLTRASAQVTDYAGIELTNLADSLVDLIGAFKVGDEDIAKDDVTRDDVIF